MALAGLGQAGEQGVREHHPAVRADRDVVDVEVAGGPGELRHVEPVVAPPALPGFERVVEPRRAAVLERRLDDVEAVERLGEPLLVPASERPQIPSLINSPATPSAARIGRAYTSGLLVATASGHRDASACNTSRSPAAGSVSCVHVLA